MSRAIVTPTGKSGNDWFGAVTTIMRAGSTTLAISRTTRCNINSFPNRSVALSRPIRLDLPPQRMIAPFFMSNDYVATFTTTAAGERRGVANKVDLSFTLPAGPGHVDYVHR